METDNRPRLLNRNAVLFFLSAIVSLFLLACAMAAIRVFIQLDDLRSADTDNIQHTVTQSEIDHLKLQTAATALQASEPQSVDAFRNRFDVFYSRITILRTSAVYRSALVTTDAPRLLTEIETFLNRMIPIVDGPDAALFDNRAQLVANVDALTQPVQALSEVGLLAGAARDDAERAALTTKLVTLSVVAILMVIAMFALMIQLWVLYRRFRKRAKQNRATMRRIGTILDTALDAILVVDRRGCVLEANPAAQEMIALEDETGLRRTIDRVLMRKADEGEITDVSGEMLMNSCKDAPNRCSKLLVRGRDGQTIPVEMSASLAHQNGLKVTVCCLRDISRRLKAEAEMKAARDRALAGEQAQARFLGMISHEMRTPLNGMLGTLDLLEDTSLSKEQTRYTAIIQSSGQQLLTQINDALDLTQAGSGKLSLNQHRFDLDELLHETLALQSNQADAMGTQLRLIMPDGPLGTVRGDRARLLQVLVNLVSNAVKFTSNGDITVEAARPTPGRHWVEFQIADTGTGIPEQDLPHIFEDFVRAGGDGAADVPGTGLGLGIVRELVGLMGGELGAESIEGEGSLFWVRLPLKSVRKLAQIAETDTVSDTDTQPKHVLVVEDNDINRFILSEMLEKDGHSVVLASDGYEAVANAQSEDFDLVIMDIRMPGISGIDAARQIRDLESGHAKTRLVFLTAHIQSDLKDRLHGLDAEAVLTKPLRRATLRAVLAGQSHRAPQPTPKPAEPSSDISVSPVDLGQLAQLRDTLTDDKLSAALDKFETEADAFFRVLPALRDGDRDRLATDLHRLAGSAAIFGATALQASAAAAEAAILAKDTERQDAQLDKLRALWRETRAELRDFRIAA